MSQQRQSRLRLNFKWPDGTVTQATSCWVNNTATPTEATSSTIRSNATPASSTTTGQRKTPDLPAQEDGKLMGSTRVLNTSRAEEEEEDESTEGVKKTTKITLTTHLGRKRKADDAETLAEEENREGETGVVRKRLRIILVTPLQRAMRAEAKRREDEENRKAATEAAKIKQEEDGEAGSSSMKREGDVLGEDGATVGRFSESGQVFANGGRELVVKEEVIKEEADLLGLGLNDLVVGDWVPQSSRETRMVRRTTRRTTKVKEGRVSKAGRLCI